MWHSGLNTFLQLINSNYRRKGDANFSKIIQSIRKQTRKQANTSNKPQERGGGSVLIVVIICFLKCPISNKKYKTCRGRGKYNPYTNIWGGKKAGNRNCLWEWSDIRFNKDFEVAIVTMFRELNKTMIKEVMKVWWCCIK